MEPIDYIVCGLVAFWLFAIDYILRFLAEMQAELKKDILNKKSNRI